MMINHWKMYSFFNLHTLVNCVTLLRLVLLCHCLLIVVSVRSLHGNACPEKCTCSTYNERVSCIGKQLLEIPEDIPKSVTELYLSRNHIQTIPVKAFEQLRDLKILSLESNIISKIGSEAFFGLPHLEILYLSQNRLAALQPEMFSGLLELKNLYLSQNQLKEIPDLATLRNISRLNLDSNRMYSAAFPSSFSELVNLTNVNFAHNNISTLRSSDLQPLRNSKITKLDFSNCALKSVESGVFDNLKTLQSLVFSYNTDLSIGSVSNITYSLADSNLNSLDLSQAVNGILPLTIFSPLANTPLRTLSLNHLQGTLFLANGTFAPVNKLMNLYMSYSMLEFIEPGTLSVLNQLTSLDISYSNLVVMPIDLPASLVHFDLSHNSVLKIIPNFLFQNNSNVEKIDLSYCAITSISKKAFFGLRKVQVINLSHNFLAQNSIAIDSFKYLGTLAELDLSYNTISQILTEVLIFQGLHQLKILRFNSNNCKYLPLAILHPLEKLQELYLQDNKLADVITSDKNGTFFKSQGMLNTLQLSANSIHELNSKTFQNLSNLTSLWLINNLLSSWDHETFLNVSSLTMLDLSYNSISVVKETDLHYFSDGLTVNLTGNPFSCWCDFRWFRKSFNHTGIIFAQKESYLCESPKQFEGMAFLNFNPLSIEAKCNPPYLKYILISCGIAVFIMCIIAAVIYVKRWSILLRWYKIKKSCGRCCRQSRYDRMESTDPSLGVTVSYGPDEGSIDFVKDQLVSKLNNMGKTFFIEEVVPYGTPLSNQLGMYCEALQNCEYIILVLTKDYLKDGRSKFEMKEALELCMLEPDRRSKFLVAFFVKNESEAAELLEESPKLMKTVFGPQLKDVSILQWYHGNSENQECFWEKLEEILCKNRAVNDDSNSPDTIE